MIWAKAFAVRHDVEHDLAVRALCKKLDWGGRLVRGEWKRGYVYVFDPAVRWDSKPLEIAT